ncbi:hypothetical protein K7H20_14015 [Salipiger manganoxidans]|nr:hypothetical protein [Salipiger manganoxidans]
MVSAFLNQLPKARFLDADRPAHAHDKPVLFRRRAQAADRHIQHGGCLVNGAKLAHFVGSTGWLALQRWHGVPRRISETLRRSSTHPLSQPHRHWYRAIPCPASMT